MTKKSRCKLPDKPSALIRVALADLRKAERDTKYVIDMEEWHRPPPKDASDTLAGYDPATCTVKPQKGKKCAVCFAGSVMAFSLNAPTEASLWAGDYPKGLKSKLTALNEFRCGHISDGLQILGFSDSKVEKILHAMGVFDDVGIVVAHYDEDSEEFKADMAKLARRFAKVGL